MGKISAFFFRNIFFISAAFFITSCFIAFYGYKFNIWDQAENLTPVYKLLINSLFKDDFYIQWFFSAFSIRYFYVYLVYLLSSVSTVAFACFMLTVSMIFLSVFAWLKIAFEFTQSYLASFLASILTFFVFYKFTAGGNLLLYNMISPSQIAKPLASLAIFYLIRNQFQVAAILLALTFYFQQLVGFQLFILFSGVLIFTKQFKTLVRFGLVYLLFIAPLLIKIIYKLQIIEDCDIDKQVLHQLNLIRHFRHFLPKYFPIFDIFKYLFLWVLGVVSILQLRNLIFKKEILFFYVFQILGVSIYSIISLNFSGLSVLQFFKTTVWIVPFSSIFIVGFLFQNINFLQKLNFYKYSRYLIFSGIGLWIVLCFSKFIPFDKLKTRYQFAFYQESELTLCHKWIASNTPLNALFIIPPDNSSFACEAQRSQLANVGAYIHTGCYSFFWNERLKRYYNVDLLKINRDSIFTQYLMKSYPYFHPQNTKLSFRLDDKSIGYPIIKNSQILYESEHYLVRKLN